MMNPSSASSAAELSLTVNGESKRLPPGSTCATLLEQLGQSGAGRVAIEVNEEIVPRSQWHEHGLKPGDQVEVIVAVGGG